MIFIRAREDAPGNRRRNTFAVRMVALFGPMIIVILTVFPGWIKAFFRIIMSVFI